MANPLDLEEQEQLDQLKHFWKQYGNAITWSLIVVLGVFASWNFYNYWQRSQSTAAAALYSEVDRVSQLPDITQLDRAFSDMKERYPSSIYSQQAGLLTAKQNFETGNVDGAKSALTWVTQSSLDTGFKSIARLRLAGVLSESRDYAGAMNVLQSSFPAAFDALAADRRGDIFMLQNNQPEALIEFKKAFNLFEERSEYRRLVEVKLNALGIDPIGTSFDGGDRASLTEGSK